jgi:hypothetical protein
MQVSCGASGTTTTTPIRKWAHTQNDENLEFSVDSGKKRIVVVKRGPCEGFVRLVVLSFRLLCLTAAVPIREKGTRIARQCVGPV